LWGEVIETIFISSKLKYSKKELKFFKPTNFTKKQIRYNVRKKGRKMNKINFEIWNRIWKWKRREMERKYLELWHMNPDNYLVHKYAKWIQLFWCSCTLFSQYLLFNGLFQLLTFFTEDIFINFKIDIDTLSTFFFRYIQKYVKVMKILNEITKDLCGAWAWRFHERLMKFGMVKVVRTEFLV